MPAVSRTAVVCAIRVSRQSMRRNNPLAAGSNFPPMRCHALPSRASNAQKGRTSRCANRVRLASLALRASSSLAPPVSTVPRVLGSRRLAPAGPSGPAALRRALTQVATLAHEAVTETLLDKLPARPVLRGSSQVQKASPSAHLAPSRHILRALGIRIAPSAPVSLQRRGPTVVTNLTARAIRTRTRVRFPAIARLALRA